MPLRYPSARALALIPCSLIMASADKWLFPLVSVSFVSLLLFLSALSGFSASYALFSTQPPPSYVRRGAAHPPPSPTSSPAPAAIPAASSASSSPCTTPGTATPAAGTHMGSSGLAATLRAAAVLLRLDPGWDWFVTLSAADYPLVTQDDLIHVFSSVPRDLNFIDHSSDVGWKEFQRVQPIIVDAGIYLAGRNQYFQASEKRATPDAFKFFTGSPWVILSRRFIEYCILGWDNLPRTLLLYFTNVVLSQEGYFHSVMCNSPDFQNKTVNTDLREWSPFARQFREKEPVLDKIDEKILGKRRHRPIPGAWCSGKKSWWSDSCSQWSNVNIVRPSPQAEKLKQSIKELLEEPKRGLHSCKQ
uniref:Beta-glucuronosyltransferase GlcAT14A n=1 Tax=Ananas comosus var. bracteatus TaxID=296719 RepID=A0A6V7QHV4_ANACO|nr:unnamed protein product [Ananas comosus var. bracteatus]